MRIKLPFGWRISVYVWRGLACPPECCVIDRDYRISIGLEHVRRCGAGDGA